MNYGPVARGDGLQGFAKHTRPFILRALLLGIGAALHGKFLEGRSGDIREFLFRSELRAAFGLADLGHGGVADDGMEPGGEVGSPLELGELAVGKQKSVLQCVLAVLLIAQHEPGGAPKFWQARSEEIVQFGGRHIGGQNLLVVRLMHYAKAEFFAQIAPYARKIQGWLGKFGAIRGPWARAVITRGLLREIEVER